MRGQSKGRVTVTVIMVAALTNICIKGNKSLLLKHAGFLCLETEKGNQGSEEPWYASRR